MALTPETRAVLDARKKAGLADVHTLTPPQAREQMRRMREAMATGAPIEPVASVEDRSIPGPGGPIPVRIYWPSEDPALPLYVYFHGGGWVIGDLDSHDAVCRSVANLAQACVVSVDYRLAPEHRYPAAVDDCYAAVTWAVESAADLGTDASLLAIGGDSAGGNLAAAVALMARDRGGPAIRSQILVYPVTDCDFSTVSYRENGTGEFGLSEAGMRWYWDCYLSAPEDAADPYAAPLRAVDLSGLPPALVITAEYDPLRDEGEEYARRLEAAGVPVVSERYAGVVHGFVSQATAVPEGRAAIERIAQELRSVTMQRTA